MIGTARLLLREFRAEDLPAFHELLIDHAVMAYAPTLPHESLEQSRDWLARRLAIPAGRGEDFVIEYMDRIIGKAGFPQFPEIGFLIARDCWGRGLAREAVAAVIRRGFVAHGLERVAARVDPENHASLRLLGKLGFIVTGREERAILVGNEWRDDVHLELTEIQWRKSLEAG